MKCKEGMTPRANRRVKRLDSARGKAFRPSGEEKIKGTSLGQLTGMS